MTVLTVLLATYNGQHVLPRTLEGYRQLRTSVPWQLIVVDNGSNDGTARIIETYRSLLPMSVYQQPRPGKNYALNKGVEHAAGETVILTDDDAIPQTDFLSAWERSLRACPDASLFGGTVDLTFDVELPQWMLTTRRHFAALYAENVKQEGPIRPDEIFGPNMAVRRQVFAAGFRFDHSIGPNAAVANYPMGSETEFCLRVARHGYKSWFAKDPRVSHIVRNHQSGPDFWARRAYRHGRGYAQIHFDSNPTLHLRLSSKAKQMLRKIATLSPIPRQRYWHLWEYHWQRGFQTEFLSRMSGAPALCSVAGSVGRPTRLSTFPTRFAETALRLHAETDEPC